MLSISKESHCFMFEMFSFHSGFQLLVLPCFDLSM